MTNKKHVIITIVFILLGILAFALAGGGDDEVKREVNLYFFDEGGYAITPVETEISAVSDTELYEKIAKALINGPTDKEYLPIMEKTVELNYIHFADGNLAVDFSKEYPEDNYILKVYTEHSLEGKSSDATAAAYIGIEDKNGKTHVASSDPKLRLIEGNKCQRFRPCTVRHKTVFVLR